VPQSKKRKIALPFCSTSLSPTAPDSTCVDLEQELQERKSKRKVLHAQVLLFFISVSYHQLNYTPKQKLWKNHLFSEVNWVATRSLTDALAIYLNLLRSWPTHPT